MPITLPSGVDAWKNGTSYSWHVLVESTDLDFHWSTGYSDVDNTWEARIPEDAVSEIVLSMPIGGGLCATNSMTITVIEDGVGTSPKSLFESVDKISGADITVSILPDFLTYADKIVRYTGVIETIRWISETRAQIFAVDEVQLRDVQLPRNIVTKTAYPNAHDRAVGQAIPFFYGSFPLVSFYPISRSEFGLPTLYVDIVNHVYLVASHANTGNVGSYRYFIVLDPNKVKKGTAWLLDSSDMTPNTADSTLTFSKDIAEVSLPLFQLPGVLTASQHYTGGSIFNITLSTFAELGTSIFTDADGNGYGYANVQFSLLQDGIPLDAQSFSRIRILFFMIQVGPNADARTYAQVKIRIVDASSNIIQDNIHYQFFLNKNLLLYRYDIDDKKLANGNKIEYRIEALHSSGPGTVNNDVCRAGGVVCQVGIKNLDPLETIYAAFPAGRPDTAGFYQQGASTATLTNPASIIFSILEQEIGIDVTSAQVSASIGNFGGWEFAGGIGYGWRHTRISAQELLDSMCKQCQSVMYPFADVGFVVNLLSLPVELLVASGGFNEDYNSEFDKIITNAAYDFSPRDILTSQSSNGGEGANYGSTLQFWQGELSETFNRFEIRYNYNPVSQDFEKVAYCNASGTNSAHENASEIVALCTSSEAIYGERGTKIIEANWIYNSSVADRLLDFTVRNYWKQRFFASFDTKWQALHLTLGDVVSLTHPSLPSTIDQSGFNIHEIRTDVMGGRIHLEMSHVDVS